MAGGLGTRMRSAVPKHLHPILGRRMVDWVLEAARPLEPGAARRHLLAGDPRRVRRRARSLCRSAPLGTGDADPLGPRGRRRAARTSLLVLSGDTPLLTADLLAGARRHPPARAGRLPPCSPSSPPTFAPTAGSSAPRDGTVQRDRRGRATRRRSSSRSRECNSSIYVFRTELLWPALERLEPAQRPGRALPHRRRSRPRRARRARRRARRRRRGRDRGREHARRAGGRGRRAPRPDQPRAHAGRSRDHRPGVDLDRARTSSSSRTPSCEPFTVLRGTHARRRRSAEIGPHAVVDRRRDRRRGAGRALLLPSPRNGSRAALEGRNVRGAQEGASSAKGPRCPTSPTSGMRRSGEDTNIGAGIDHRELPAPPGPAEGKDDDRPTTSASQWTLCSLLRSLLATMRGRRPGPSSPTTSRTNALAGFPPRQVNKEGRGGKRDD